MRAQIFGSGLLVVMAVAVGCKNKPVPLETHGAPGGAAGAAGAATPGGTCELRPEPDGGSYGTCSASFGGDETQYFGDCVSATTWFLYTELACAACFCSINCIDDEDCPVPETGNVTPVCTNRDSCSLPCDGGKRCPDGMHCTELPDEDGKYCVWLLNEQNSLMCAWEDGWEECSEFSTAVECEGRIDNDPRQPRVACLWATVSTFASGSDGCTPLLVEEKCVGARLPNAQAMQASGRCGDRSVHWTDLGAGRMTLTELSRCGYEPIDTTPCDPGDPSNPQLCSCGCE